MLIRPPSAGELSSLLQWVEAQRILFTDNPDHAQLLTGAGDDDTATDPVEWAVWTATARALFALDETVMRE